MRTGHNILILLRNGLADWTPIDHVAKNMIFKLKKKKKKKKKKKWKMKKKGLEPTPTMAAMALLTFKMVQGRLKYT